VLRPIAKQFKPTNGLDPPPGMPLRQTLLLRCGHFARRKPKANGLWLKVHCDMCSMLSKERESKAEKRARKKKRREERKRKQQSKVERLNMAKKKIASKKVVKKADLKKKGGKLKKEKGEKIKVGRKLMLVATHLYTPKGSLLAKVVKAMQAAKDHIMGENELAVAMEKAGVKAEGTKTVKKQVKAVLRNMLRAGVVVKQREIKHNDELKAFVGEAEEDEDADEDGDESESEESDDDEEEAEAADEDGEEEAEEDAEDEDEKPKAKKKVIKKKGKK
jgi:hypothetical protein